MGKYDDHSCLKTISKSKTHACDLVTQECKYLSLALGSTMLAVGAGHPLYLLLKFGDALYQHTQSFHALGFIFSLHRFIFFQFGQKELQT